MSPDASHLGSPRPQTFVVPLDGSDFACRAVPVAADLTRRFDADLVLMSAPTTLAYDEGALLPGWLHEVAQATDAARIETVVAEVNDPVDELLRLLGTHPDPVVAMATHGRGRARRRRARRGRPADRARRPGVPLLLVGRACASPRVVGGPGARVPRRFDRRRTPPWPRRSPGPTGWGSRSRWCTCSILSTSPPPKRRPRRSREPSTCWGPGTIAHVVRNYRPADAIQDVAQRIGAHRWS